MSIGVGNCFCRRPFGKFGMATFDQWPTTQTSQTISNPLRGAHKALAVRLRDWWISFWIPRVPVDPGQITNTGRELLQIIYTADSLPTTLD